MSLAGPRATARRPALVVMVATAASVALLDQVTKSLALARLADGPVDLVWTLRFRLAFNSGLAFSQGSGLTPLITAAGVLLVGGLVWFSRRVTRPAVAAGLGLVLGGACANLADRLVRGHGGAVVDFIDLGWWPVFNVADMAITGGAFVLIAVSMREPLGGEG